MENISVSVRVRPLSKLEAAEGNAWRIDGSTIFQTSDRTDVKYTLDHVFGPDLSTQQIYEQTTRSLIAKVVNGFNSTVFAYGQTSSGKTFTMRGSESEAGLIPLAVHEVFELIEGSQDREFLIRVSYTELYNEEVNDLLSPENIKLPIHESKENGVYVCGLREEIVTSPSETLALLEQGERNRHVGSTKMNEKSSRSHTLFRMVIESRARDAACDDAGAILVSTLTLVDLAGSERIAKTGAEGIRMKEGTAINKSLLTLGTVINKLSEGALVSGGHIPYRDSKLTRILQPSLGGNAKTAIICAMTPASCHVEESHSTLRFASRAKRVVNNAVVNEVLSDAAVLKRQAKEIEELKRRLGAAGNDGGEVMGQVGHLRAQLLRQEQEMQLMRTKLLEVNEEREKAEKKVNIVKKMMLEQGRPSEPDTDEPGRKNSRRLTWCPGRKAGWLPPAGLSESGLSGGREDSEDATLSGGRKRSLSSLAEDGAESRRLAKAGSHQLGQLEEGDEEEEEDLSEDRNGPTPQRRRRERSTKSVDFGDGDLISQLQRIAAALAPQDRWAVESAVQQLKDEQMRAESMQREVQDLSQVAQERQDELRATQEQLGSLTDEHSRLVPQIEQLKWQIRQGQKRTEEMQTNHAEALQAHEGLISSVAQLKASLQAKEEELASQASLFAEEREAAKDQTRKLSLELADTRGQLELQATEKGRLETKHKVHASEIEAVEGRLAERVHEVEELRRQLQAGQDRTQEAEAKGKELTEKIQRLESHVRDLESRKRAPLYQKKQEEELRVATEKAAEAEARAQEAEAKAKELKIATEAAEKLAAELNSQLDKMQKQSVEALATLAEQQSLELQKAVHERSLLQVAHETELQTQQAKVQEVEAQVATLKQEAEGLATVIAGLQEQIAVLNASQQEREAAQEELQACATAAAEKISYLEETAEATQMAHEQELAALKVQLETATADAASAAASYEQRLQEASQAAAKAKEAGDQALLAAKAQADIQLHEEKDRSGQLVLASMEECTRLTTARDDLQQQVDALQLKVAEAAGALKAKEELKEERLKHKQEMSTLKADLQKLQLESKTGNKGKELATKELETLKKKLVEVENKLKVAVADRQTAVAEKANLEKQLKQQQGQKLLIEKSLEKKDAMENKKRESIMVNLSKKQELLSTTEERLKQCTVEIQKLQMDLMAKKGECTGLEEQVAELEGANGQLKGEVESLSMELTTCQHNLQCLQQEHTEMQGQLQSTSDQLASVSAEHTHAAAELSVLSAQHSALVPERNRLDAELKAIKVNLVELEGRHSTLSSQLKASSEECAVLKARCEKEEQDHAAAKQALLTSQEARIAAEARLPELEELQRMMARTHEEMSDLSFQMNEEKATAAARQQDLAQQLEASQQQCTALEMQRQQLSEELKASQLRASDLTRQLEDTVELYNLEQGRATTQQETCASAQAAVQRLELELHRLEGLGAASGAEVAELRGQVATLETQLKSALDDASAASSELLGLREALVAAGEHLEQVSQQRRAAEQDAAELRQTMDEQRGALSATEAKVRQLEEQLLAAQEREQEQKRHMEQLQQQQQQQQQQHTAAEPAGAAEIASLQQQLSSVLQELNDLQFRTDQDKAVAAMELQRLTEALSAAQEGQAAQAAVHRQVAELQQRVQELADTAAESEVKLAAAQHHISRLQAELESARAQVQESVLHAGSEQAVLELQQQAESMQLQLQQGQSQVQDLQQRLHASTDACAALEQQLAQTQATLVQPQSEAAQAGQESTAAKPAGALEIELADLQAAYNRVTAEKEDVERTLSIRLMELETRCLELQDLVQELQARPPASAEGAVPPAAAAGADELERLAADVARLQTALSNAVTAKEAVQAKLEAEVQELQQAVKGLEAELAAEHGRGQVSDTQANQQLSLQVAELRRLLDEQHDKRKAAEALAEQVGQEANDAMMQLQAAELALAEARQEAAALAERLASVEGAAKEGDVGRSNLQAILAKTEGEVREARSLVQRLEQELQEQGAASAEALRQAAAEAAELLQLNTQLEAQALEARQQLRAAQQSAATAQESVRLRLADMQEELQLATSRAEAQSQLASALHGRVQQLESELKECKESLTAAEVTLVARLAAQRQALQEVAAAQAEQHAIALEEVEMNAKAKEAELNATLLSLESQIHWLKVQNTQLHEAKAAAQQSSANAVVAAPAPAAATTVAAADHAEVERVTARCTELEGELRKSKRAEQKLQALLYRLRKDVSDNHANIAPLMDGLKDLRSLQYDCDLLTQKLKRYERYIAQLEAQQGGGQPVPLGLKQTPIAPQHAKSSGAGEQRAEAGRSGAALSLRVDKENMHH